MLHPSVSDAPNRRADIAALVAALLCAWRLPVAFGLKAGNAVFAGHAITLVLAAGLLMLFRSAFCCRDKRLWGCACGLGLIYALMTVVGEHLKQNEAFLPVTWLSVLDGVFLLALFALAYGSALMLLFQWADGVAAREPGEKKESLFSKLLGNGFVVFALLMLCWLPIWLACWPGTLVADSVTQFYQYMDMSFSTHHPLLHTLFLGFCLMTGVDIDPDGSPAPGLAIYSVAQMAIMAAILGYACWWLRRRRAPLWARVCVTALFAVFPLYSLWSFSAQKDVLFGGFVLLFALQLVDLWRDGYALLRSPLRVIAFVLTAVVMMLLRNNGVYALCLLIPFAILLAKGARWRVTALLVGCVAAYLLANTGLIALTEAESGSKVEMLSIPLQQIARALRDDPEALNDEDRELLETLYAGELPSAYYYPPLADPVKWAIDYDALDESVPELLSLWARLGVTHLKSYAEAILVQNLPYYLPGANAEYNLDLGLAEIELYPMEAHSYLPQLHKALMSYDQTLTLWGLPGVRLLSDTALMMWLCMAGVALALYRRQRRWPCAFGIILAMWVTCLLGPVALMRYMLSAFYAVPVLLAGMLASDGRGKAVQQ